MQDAKVILKSAF